MRASWMDVPVLRRGAAMRENAARRTAGAKSPGLLRLRRFWFILLLPASFLLTSLAAAYPAVTERIYSTGVYPVLTGVFGRISSLAPFSIAEWMVLLGPPGFLLYIILAIRAAIREKSARRDRLCRLAATLCCAAGAGFFLFAATCGLGYHRLSFAETSGLELRPSSLEELAALCEELVEKASAQREHLAERDGVMISSYAGYGELAAFAQGSYQALAAEYPALGGYTARPKPVLFSRGMSYLDITGVYTFYSTEVNINTDVADYSIPCTMLHELAHFKGYMREDEANFIAYLACERSNSAEFAYSGTMLALIHSTNALYAADSGRYNIVMGGLSDAVWRDLAANTAYWRQFEGPVAEVSAKVNDVYLKSNSQPAGVKSYGRMVDLLLAYSRAESIEE